MTDDSLPPEYPYSVTIEWGEVFSREETYQFESRAELAAFLMGVAESDGWIGYTITKRTDP